jgi:hypothetical protein
MFFKRKKKTDPTSSERLRARMFAIGEDAATIAGMIRAGKPAPSVHFDMPLDGPIRTPNSEELFQTKGSDGHLSLSMYHYTADFKDLDMMAQVDLMNLFSDVIRANCILSAVAGRVVTFEGGNAIKGLLDQIMVSAAFFEEFFDRTDVSAAMMMGKLDERALRKKCSVLKAAADKRYAQVREDMFRPDMFAQFVPMREFRFIACAAGPAQTGQKFINGVHFPAELADAVASIAARRQGETLGNRPRAQAS